MKTVWRKTLNGTVLGLAVANLPLSALACTSMIFQAQDGTNIYARTMEWGASDLNSEMAMVPRNMDFQGEAAPGVGGIVWKNT